MAEQKTNYEVAVEMVTKTAGKNVTPYTRDTGVTFFLTPKQRLCKVVRTKKNVRLEMNLELGQELIKKLNDISGYDLQQITPEIAKKKKYGTMKWLLNAVDNKHTEEIIKNLLAEWKKN